MSCCLRACQDSRFVTCFLCMSCLGMRFVFVDVKIRDSWQVLVHVILFSCMSRFAFFDMFLCMSFIYILCLRACQDSRFVTCFCVCHVFTFFVFVYVKIHDSWHACFLCMSYLGMRFVFVHVKIRASWHVFVQSCLYVLCLRACQDSRFFMCKNLSQESFTNPDMYKNFYQESWYARLKMIGLVCRI